MTGRKRSGVPPEPERTPLLPLDDDDNTNSDDNGDVDSPSRSGRSEDDYADDEGEQSEGELIERQIVHAARRSSGKRKIATGTADSAEESDRSDGGSQADIDRDSVHEDEIVAVPKSTPSHPRKDPAGKKSSASKYADHAAAKPVTGVKSGSATAPAGKKSSASRHAAHAAAKSVVGAKLGCTETSVVAKQGPAAITGSAVTRAVPPQLGRGAKQPGGTSTAPLPPAGAGVSSSCPAKPVHSAKHALVARPRPTLNPSKGGRPIQAVNLPSDPKSAVMGKGVVLATTVANAKRAHVPNTTVPPGVRNHEGATVPALSGGCIGKRTSGASRSNKSTDSSQPGKVSSTVAVPGQKRSRQGDDASSNQVNADNSDDGFQPDHALLHKRRKTLREHHAAALAKKAAAKAMKVAKKDNNKPVVSRHADGHGAQHDDDVKASVKEEVGVDVKPHVRITPKQAYTYIMDEYVPQVDVAFNYTAQARSASIAIFDKVEKLTIKDDLSLKSFSEIFRGLLFVRKTDDTLEQSWQSGEGKIASKLRRRIMLCCLHMARRNLYDDFSTGPFGLRNSTPSWLVLKIKREDGTKVDYLVNKHIINTVDLLEKRQEPKDDYRRREMVARRGKPNRSDVGLYAFTYLYGSLRRMFTRTRKDARMIFFQKLGYLFMDWSQYKKCSVHDSTVTMCWAAPIHAPISDVETPLCSNYGDVKRERAAEQERKRMKQEREGNVKREREDGKPMKEEQGFGEEPMNEEQGSGEERDNKSSGDVCPPGKDVDEKPGNDEVYVAFGRSADDVTLLVEHDVIVCKDREGKAIRKRTGCKRRTWRKAVNLIDVTRDMLHLGCGFLKGHPMYDVLLANRNSIRCLYNMARALRVFLSSLPQRTIMLHVDNATDDNAMANVNSNKSHDGNDDCGLENGGGVDDDNAGVTEGGGSDGMAELTSTAGDEHLEQEGHDVEHHYVDEEDRACEGHSAAGGEQLDQTALEGEHDHVEQVEREGKDDSTAGGEMLENEGRDGEPDQGERGEREGEHVSAAADCCDAEDIAEEMRMATTALWDVLMAQDIANEHNLKQVTGTVSEQMYWAEHIGAANNSTKLFGHISLKGKAALLTEEGMMDKSDEEEEEEDFAM